MWIKRKPTRDDISTGTAAALDFIENGANRIGEVPVVGVASGRMRSRVTGYTNPLSRLLRRKKNKS